MILIESIEKVWCEMREFVKSMECNQKLINQLGYSCSGRGSSLFDKWTSIRDYETAKKMLSETTIENIAYGFRIVKDSFGNLIRQELGFQDFVELIKECIDTNCDLLWS